MRVKRDFDAIYARETDPWAIGDAESPRYDLYRSLLLGHTAGRGSMLDVGCGLGAFLARFRGDFEHLTGVELSAEAVRRARARFEDVSFHVGSAAALGRSAVDAERFDAIAYSDVIYYLDDDEKRESLEWVATHLAPGGVALVAAWCPGGKYLEPDELRALVAAELRVVDEHVLESGHAVFVGTRRRRLVALTVDYETWQPIPDGRRIDWNDDVLGPGSALLDAAREDGFPLTLFVEVAELLWLRENEPAVAAEVEEQLRTAVADGHELGLHLHPSWLPELGARRDGDVWTWDWTRAKAADYPGDLTALIGRCVALLESLGAGVSTFRAGTYQAQPFDRLYRALRENGIAADSSVYRGGVSAERGYDYSLAYSGDAPYFAAATDPQLKAPPSETGLVELPIFTFGAGERLMFDGAEGDRFATRLIEEHTRRRQRRPTAAQQRRAIRWRGLLGMVYVRLEPLRPLVNAVVPRRLLWAMSTPAPDRTVGHDYAVAIGHTKGDLRVDAVRRGARALRDAGFEVVTLADAAAIARQELTASVRDVASERDFQVRRERAAVLGDARNDRQSHRLQEMIPLDRTRVLDLGCGAGHWSGRIARLYPWMEVVGVDAGADFVAHAAELYAGPRVSFLQADFLALPFADESFDCVYADNTLEHAFDVDATLGEVHRVLRDGGVLVAAIPSDARNPRYLVDNHTWKTAPHDVLRRVRAAGFTNVEIEEVDVLRTLRQAPYPPSRDRMQYVRAWKRPAEASQAERAAEATAWVYEHLDPETPSTSNDAIEVLAGGHAYCAGYAVAIGELLRREAIDVSWVTMEAAGHPRGRGAEQLDTHTVVAATLDGREHIVDAMSNVIVPHPLAAALANPALVPEQDEPDERWRSRGYELYGTSFWYERVRRFQRHGTLSPKLRLWRRAPKRAC